MDGAEMQCKAMMVHSDRSKSRCVLPADHQKIDSDHVDEHGHRAPVLVHQSTIEEVRRWQDVPFPWEEDKS